MRLSVITPTVARDSLRNTLASIAPQLQPDDQHLVIGDGAQLDAASWCAEFGAEYHDGPSIHDWGVSQRDYGITLATGDVLLFCDDDDVFTTDALATVRAAVADNPTTPHIFRMFLAHLGRSLWKTQEVREGNVGTPMIVTPRYDDLPRWADRFNPYTADHRFAKRITDAHGVIWREEVICIVRPEYIRANNRPYAGRIQYRRNDVLFPAPDAI